MKSNTKLPPSFGKNPAGSAWTTPSKSRLPNLAEANLRRRNAPSRCATAARLVETPEVIPSIPPMGRSQSTSHLEDVAGVMRSQLAVSPELRPTSKQYFQEDGTQFKRWSKQAMGRNPIAKVWDESGRPIPAEVVAVRPRRAESPANEVTIPEIPTGQARSCIFFDWDDTLCPTSFLQQVVLPCLPHVAGQELPQIRKENPFYEELSGIAKLIEEVLRSAKKLASVAIITLARRPWLNDVAEACLPGLNLPSLLTELQIPVLYAREHVPMAVANQGSPGAYIRAKRDAMRSCVKQLFGNTANVKGFISIGDSEIEHCALQQLVGSIGANSMMQTPASGMPHCKIVRFSLQPTIPQLQQQVSQLRSSLCDLVSHQGNLNVEISSLRMPRRSKFARASMERAEAIHQSTPNLSVRPSEFMNPGM
mmetsp:Transcript_62012/g.145461  ORF Transcript_62012/g.145461 Transcript_62012/m.145461 type:complete len:422 (+) Transcript_62012:90-1355(+)